MTLSASVSGFKANGRGLNRKCSPLQNKGHHCAPKNPWKRLCWGSDYTDSPLWCAPSCFCCSRDGHFVDPPTQKNHEHEWRLVTGKLVVFLVSWSKPSQNLWHCDWTIWHGARRGKTEMSCGLILAFLCVYTPSATSLQLITGPHLCAVGFPYIQLWLWL